MTGNELPCHKVCVAMQVAVEEARRKREDDALRRKRVASEDKSEDGKSPAEEHIEHIRELDKEADLVSVAARAACDGVAQQHHVRGTSTCTTSKRPHTQSQLSAQAPKGVTETSDASAGPVSTLSNRRTGGEKSADSREDTHDAPGFDQRVNLAAVSKVHDPYAANPRWTPEDRVASHLPPQNSSNSNASQAAAPSTSTVQQGEHQNKDAPTSTLKHAFTTTAPSTKPRLTEGTSRSHDFGVSMGLARAVQANAGMTVLRRSDKDVGRSKFARELNNGGSDASTASTPVSRMSSNSKWPRGVAKASSGASSANSKSVASSESAAKPVSAKTNPAIAPNAHTTKAKSWANAVVGTAYSSSTPSHIDTCEDSLIEGGEPGIEESSNHLRTKPESWAAAARAKPAFENAWQGKPKGELARGFAALQAQVRAPASVAAASAAKPNGPSHIASPAESSANKPAKKEKQSQEVHKLSAASTALSISEAKGHCSEDSETPESANPDKQEDSDANPTPPARRVWAGELPAALRAPPSTTKSRRGAAGGAKTKSSNNDSFDPNIACTVSVLDHPSPRDMDGPCSHNSQGDVKRAAHLRPPRGDVSSFDGIDDRSLSGRLDQQEGQNTKPSPNQNARSPDGEDCKDEPIEDSTIIVDDKDQDRLKGQQHSIDHIQRRESYSHERNSQRAAQEKPKAQQTQQHDQHRRAREEAEGAAYQARRASVGRQTEEERNRRIKESYSLDSEAAAERVANRAWAAAQLEESHERREFERRRSAGVMRKRLARDVDDFIRRLDAAMAPQRLARAAVLANVTDVVNSIWAHAECCLYGSCLTGLDLPSSDVDVVVRGLGGDPTPNPPQTTLPARGPLGQHSPSAQPVPSFTNTAPRIPYLDAADVPVQHGYLTSPTAPPHQQPQPAHSVPANHPLSTMPVAPSLPHLSSSSRTGAVKQQMPQLPPRPVTNAHGAQNQQQSSVGMGTSSQLQPTVHSIPSEIFAANVSVEQQAEAQHPPLPRGTRRRKLDSEPSDYSGPIAASSRDSNDSEIVPYEDDYEYEDFESMNNDDVGSAFGDGSQMSRQAPYADNVNRTYAAPTANTPGVATSTSAEFGFHFADDEASERMNSAQQSTTFATASQDAFDDTASDALATNDETASITSSERAIRRVGKPHELRMLSTMSSPHRRTVADAEDHDSQQYQRPLAAGHIDPQTALATGVPVRPGHHIYLHGGVVATPPHATIPGMLVPHGGGVDALAFPRVIQNHPGYSARVAQHRASTPTRIDTANQGLQQRHPYLRSPTPPATAPAGVVMCLKTLAAALSSRPWVRELKAIETASIPVIKLLADPALLDPPAPLPSLFRERTKPGGDDGELNEYIDCDAPIWRGAIGRCDAGLLAVDISFEAPNHGGLASSRYAIDTMSRWPEAAPLMLVLKELLAQHRLNEPFTGGLSSYSLLLLVITAMLQAGVVRLSASRIIASSS